MAKELNLSNTKKSFFTLTFVDGKKILVKMPTKKIFDELLNVQDNVESMENLDEVLSVLSSALSNNMARKNISKEYLANQLDIEDIVVIFKAYTEFVQEAANSKN